MLALALFLRGSKDELLNRLGQVAPRFLPVLMIAVLLHTLTNALRYKILLSVFSIRLPFVEWFGLTGTNTMLGYCMPARGGVAVRGLYLKQKHGLSFTLQASLLAGASLVCMFLSSVAALVFLAAERLLYGKWIQELFWFVLATMVGMAIVLRVLAQVRPGHCRFRNRRARKNAVAFVRGLQLFRQRHRALAGFAAAHFLSLALFGFRLLLSCEAVGIRIAPLRAMTVQSLTDFSSMIAITPGNMGIKEGVIVFLSSRFGLPRQWGASGCGHRQSCRVDCCGIAGSAVLSYLGLQIHQV